MRKIRGGRDSERRVGAAMVGMTGRAIQIRILARHRPMQRGDFAHLHGYIDVTGCTAISHGQRIPRRNVTGLALPACLRMRCHSAEHLSRLRVEVPWAIENSALRKCYNRDDNRGDQCSNDQNEHRNADLVGNKRT